MTHDSWARRAAALITVTILHATAGRAWSAPLAEAVTVLGDSISRAFNADTSSCNYGDNLSRVWATGDDHGAAFCAAGGDATFSHAERLECAKAGNVTIFNDAESGATMLGDFHAQAAAAKTHLAAAPSPRYVQVFMGHNDACTSTTSKSGNSCSGDRDPTNYCRTTNAAFEREFRRGMDELIQVPGTRILVLAQARASELCNFQGANGCGLTFGLPCSVVWGQPFIDICRSLTDDCSAQRRIDMYETQIGYNEILGRITEEYAAMPAGGVSATGATKASDVAILFSDGPFYYKFRSGDVSCCDCFHPSDQGQRVIAQFVWEGMQCSPTSPCCFDTGDSLTDARCDVEEHTMFYAGGFWPGGMPCGNGIIDPGEECDDANPFDGDCCSSACTLDAPGAGCETDGNDCTDDVCDGAGSCLHLPNVAPCDDGAWCTVGDACGAGECAGTPRDCSEAADACNTGGCDEDADACTPVPVPDGTGCDDGDACTVPDTCEGGECVGQSGCGDGIVDGGCGETCDDGGENGTNACCSATCTVVDGDADGICDRDDACTGPGTVLKPQLVLDRLHTPPGDDRLKLKGTLTVPFPFDPPLDPVAHGLRLIVGGSQGVLLDATLPGGGFDGGRGWWVRSNGAAFKYRDRSDGPVGGITGVVVKDRSRRNPGQLIVVIAGKNGAYPAAPADLPLRAAVVLDPPAAVSGQCGELDFAGPASTCEFSKSGSRVKCK